MFCDHCGKQIPDDAVLCPYCGVSTGEKKQSVTYYDVAQQPDVENASSSPSKEDFSHFGGPGLTRYDAPASYQRGYRAVPRIPHIPHAPRAPHSPHVPPLPPVGYPVQQPGYGPQSMNYAGYAPQQPLFVPVPVVPVMVEHRSHMKSGDAVLLEVLLSLFGIFGVGWIAGGETTIGVILLICSFVIYLPLLFLGTILTFGVGVFCLGPLAIVAIILNGVICNAALKRREARLMFMQQPSMMPVQPPVQRQVQQ